MNKIAQLLALVLVVGAFLYSIGGEEMDYKTEYIFHGLLTILLFLSFRPLKIIEEEQQKRQRKKELKNKEYFEYLCSLSEFSFTKEINIILDIKNRNEKKEHLNIYRKADTKRKTTKKTQT